MQNQVKLILKNIYKLPILSFFLLINGNLFAIDEDKIFNYSDNLISKFVSNLSEFSRDKKVDRIILKSFKLNTSNYDITTLRTLINILKQKITSVDSPKLLNPVEIRMDKVITSPYSLTLDSSFERFEDELWYNELNIQGILECEITIKKNKMFLNATLTENKTKTVIYSQNFEEKIFQDVEKSSNVFSFGLSYQMLSVQTKNLPQKKYGYPSSVNLYGLEFNFAQVFFNINKLNLNVFAIAYLLENGIAVEGMKNMIIASSSGSGYQGLEFGIGLTYNVLQNKNDRGKGYLKPFIGYGRFFGNDYNDFGVVNIKFISDITDIFSLELLLKMIPEIKVFDSNTNGEITSGSFIYGLKLNIYLN